LHSHVWCLWDISCRLRKQRDLRTSRTLLLQLSGGRRRRRSVELLWALRRIKPIRESRSRYRMSSGLNDRSDSLILQRRGRCECRRVTTMLASYGLGVGQTRGTANARRPLEQNEVLSGKGLRVGIGEILMRERELLWSRRLCRQAR
jgi:hypothetical protein